MVIVHVLSSFGVGGQERVALDLAASQVRRGHRVIAVSLAPAPDGPLAAAWARAVHVLGLERGLALLSAQDDVDAMVLDAEGRLHATAGLQALQGPRWLAPQPEPERVRA